MSNKASWIVIGLVGCVSQAFAAATSACEPWAAKVVSIQGVVEARHTTTDTWQAVTLNAVYCSGDSIRVAENSRAAVVLSNQTLLRLDQNSSITLTAIKADSPSLLDILTGWVHFISRVPRSLQVNTPFVNAAIEGTEFVVAVDKDQGSVTVFEGKVKASNTAGDVSLTHNETAVARTGEAPQKVLRAKPRDAVQWALYYPPIFAPGDPLAPAADLLYHGRVEAARQALAPFAGTPDNAKAKALLAIIAVVNNDTAQALEHAKQAVAQAPKVAATHIALSYAQQAHFDLDAALASARQAVQVEPNNALAYARLAELQLSVGYLHDALDSAQHAVQLEPQQARAHTILGFAYLTQIHVNKAQQTFNTAIELDQADPLPRLGLGLAKIRKNELTEGRREIEIAALLDPNNALIRSYLGKAYFEEKRPRLDADQFAMAKELDPNDPTPWFYDAIRLQTENRPVEALEDLQKSIELNDNRAVYRSRLQLDQDAAARSVSLSRIYSELDYEYEGIYGATSSLLLDPANYSAHRFLADLYATRSRHEIASASELLQAQILQPLSLNPIPPQLAETDLGVIAEAGPAISGMGDYNRLFIHDDINAHIDLLAGNNSTKADNILLATLRGPLSFNFSQYHYDSDGYRPNNKLTHDIYDVLVQSQLTNNLSIFVDHKQRESLFGDVSLMFSPENYDPTIKSKIKNEASKFGLNYSTPGNTLLCLLQNDRYKKNSSSYEVITFPFDVTVTTNTDISQNSSSAELQYILNKSSYNIVTGVGRANVNGYKIDTSIEEYVSPPSTDIYTFPYSRNTDFDSAYVYSNFNSGDNSKISIGAAYNKSKSAQYDVNKTNYKIGGIFRVSDNTTLRLASLTSLNGPRVSDQTLEPTQVAGFNQFFDDFNGTKTLRNGIGLDYHLSKNTTYGLESSVRRLDIPVISGTYTEYDDAEERLNILYAYWTINNEFRLTFNASQEYFENTNSNPSGTPVRIKTNRFPISLAYFNPQGYTLKSTFKRIKQSYEDSSFVTYKDDFWLVDLLFSYRLSARQGIISVGINNVFDKKFNFYDLEYTGATKNPEFLPTRSLIAKISFSL